MNDPYRVMTVCTGNICRSPMAEIVLRDRLEAAGLGDRVVVDSTGVSDEEHGNPVDPRARRVLAAHGYATGDGHRARQVTAAELADRDLVLAMTAQHARRLRRLAVEGDGVSGVGPEIRLYRSFDPAAPVVDHDTDEHLLDVEDPWYGDQGGFETTMAEIEAAADGVVEHVRTRLSARAAGARMSADAYVVRRMRADEWREARDLRLDALRDPAAPVAFLETHEDAAARPDSFWQDRARGNASSDAVAAFVAIDADGRWVGTTTGLVEEPGTTDFTGNAVERRQVHLVGVFLRPEDRGAGLLDRLFAGVQDWAREQGVTAARLCVHAANPRAQAAYRRCGFTPSGERFVLDAGEELEMVRAL